MTTRSASSSRRARRPEGDLLAVAKDDIRDACDILRPVYDEGNGKDG